MNHKTKKIIKNVRVIIVLIAVILAIVAMQPNPSAKGVAIRSVVVNSSASLAGFTSPKPTAPPMSRERIVSMNNNPISDISDYYEFISTLEPNRTVQVKTNKQLYKLTTKPLLDITILGDQEYQTFEEIVEINETIDNQTVLVNKTINKTILVNKTIEKVIGTEDLGFSVYNAPKTNIRKGLDLQGGTRVLLEPEEKLDQEGMDILIENMKYRLNIYGLSDVIVRESSDLSGNQYILVEIAGANEQEVKDLMAKQGKFEAKISNETVFRGGQDITHVCRSADCSGIDPTTGCGMSGEDWACRFRFSISLSPDAAQKQADLTSKLDVISENGQDYLSEQLSLYLDDAMVDELNIGADLKGRAVTDIQISGSGAGKTQQEAVFNSLANMKRLQTILITGSLPVKLSIVKTDNVSPALGEEFIKSAILIGLLAIVAVFIVIYARYRKLRIAVPIIITSLVEVILLLGIAAIIGWNLDLAAIAGIIIAVGTGIDHQIVITDETLRGEMQSDWKKKIKNAFFIIMGAFATTVVAMVPLMFAGAGLLKGFALTTIIGVSIGVFIARPAYAAVVEILVKE
jgi:preprotein translocase subunit SecD